MGEIGTGGKPQTQGGGGPRLHLAKLVRFFGGNGPTAHPRKCREKKGGGIFIKLGVFCLEGEGAKGGGGKKGGAGVLGFGKGGGWGTLFLGVLKGPGEFGGLKIV